MARIITKELQETVATNEHIKEVHFTQDGHHHFNVHEHEKKKYVQVFRDKVIDNKTGKKIDRVVPNLKTAIVETISRDQVLDAKVVEPAVEEEGKNKKK